MADHRYPIEPALAVARMSVKALSLHAGLSSSTLQKSKARGGLTEYVADRVAVSLGLHPYELWPEMAEHHAADELARRRKAKAASMRRWRRKPTVRAREKAAKATYYQETADYHRRRARQRYWADPEAARERVRQQRAKGRAA